MRWLRRDPRPQAGQLIRSIPVMAARAGEGLRDGLAAASGATIRRFAPGQAPVQGRRRRDPAPSRLMYRLHRLWLTPVWRRAIGIGLPVAMLALVLAAWLANDGQRAALAARYGDLREAIHNREAFMVHAMEITGASPAVERGLRGMLPVDLPASSFDIDLQALRAQVLALDAVASVDLRIKPGGVLSAAVTERVPALLWRHASGIELIDESGHRVASVTSRELRRDLPLIAGPGADRAAHEALALIDAIGPILPRLRGLERRGERRWDVVLDRGQRIMLPEEDALAALKQALALDRDGALLARDVGVVDMRRAGQMVLRMGISAQNAIRRARGQPLLAPDGTVIDETAARAAGTTGRAG